MISGVIEEYKTKTVKELEQGFLNKLESVISYNWRAKSNKYHLIFERAFLFAYLTALEHKKQNENIFSNVLFVFTGKRGEPSEILSDNKNDLKDKYKRYKYFINN